MNWQPPAYNIDGSPADDLGGYVIYLGNTSRNYDKWIDVGNVSSYTITNVPPGIYFFALTSYDIFGNESDLSNEVTKVIE